MLTRRAFLVTIGGGAGAFLFRPSGRGNGRPAKTTTTTRATTTTSTTVPATTTTVAGTGRYVDTYVDVY